MTAADVVAAVETLPGARRGAASAPITGAALVSGTEVATTKTAGEKALRRIWRDRHGGGATPLLLVADDADNAGSVLALGVSDANGPVRSIDASSLAQVLARVASLPRLEAVRELATELSRLDQAGIPGLELRDLLTLHTLDVRLRDDASRWRRAQEAVAGIPRRADWNSVLKGLGYTLEKRPRQGHLARWDGRPILVIHPKADTRELTRLDREGRPPEGMLLNDCRAEGAPFGLLAAGSRLRLFDTDPERGSSTTRFIELDAALLRDDDLPFLALLGPEHLAEGGFDDLATEARRFGSELHRRLDDTIRQRALPALGRALGRWARQQDKDPADDATREELERAALTFVFRALFLLYAESARHLPMGNRAYEQASVTSLVAEAEETADQLSQRSTSLWDRFALLVKTMRNGNSAWDVPAYNGLLFAADGFDGAATLESVELADPDVAAVLTGLGRDPATGGGVDYSTLEIGHLGHIYEGLLSLRLSVADTDLHYDEGGDRYLPAEADDTVSVEAGDLLWQSQQGGRKKGGVYYTRSELVRHLVREAVVPAFKQHLDRVRERAHTDPQAAADELFDFAVLDPACGSAHFLVVVVNELADRVVAFLAETPLPAVRADLERLRAGASAGAQIDDVSLLRRLVLKRCVFGVDVSSMGAEVAKLSLWLASFVPGLSLAYLGRNVVVGNSLVGVARPEALIGDAEKGSWLDQGLAGALEEAAEAAARVASSDDRNPEEVKASGAADAEVAQATAGLARLFDLWTAEPFGVGRARQETQIHGPAVIDGRENQLTEAAQAAADEHRFLHWPLAFPSVFHRERPGFDAVVGNPPWEEVTVEEQSFFALFQPGIRRGISEDERAAAVVKLKQERPELAERLAAEKQRAAQQRKSIAAGEYPSMPGDPDLYKLFCHRYRHLLRTTGELGVVLPRTAFGTKGSADFRAWLFEQTSCRRIDFLINRRLWMFPTHAQYTVALVAAGVSEPAANHRVEVAGTATSLAEWNTQAAGPGVALPREAFGPDWTTPLLRSQAEADVLAKVRHGHAFPYGAGGRWRCFPVRELDETNDRHLWEGGEGGRTLWKGESFGQYDPHGGLARTCSESEALQEKVAKSRPGSGSLLSAELPVQVRRRAVSESLTGARVAFHDVTQKDNSRSVVAGLIPPGVLLVNSAPYLAFAEGGDHARATCLGIMNSLPFDWQARRFVEIHLNFFILEGLVVPDMDDGAINSVAEAAARLSCVDDRFADFAESFDLEPGPILEEERLRLRVEIDARVAHAWELTTGDLEVVLGDFTLDAVPDEHRRALRDRLAELS